MKKRFIKRLLSLSFAMWLLLCCSTIHAYATFSKDTTSTKQQPFVLSHLTDNSGKDNLIITILQNTSENVTVKLLEIDDVIEERTICLDDTNMIEFIGLKENGSYKLEVEMGNIYVVDIKNFTAQDNVCATISNISNAQVTQNDNSVLRISGGTYQAKNSSGNIGTAKTSMWEAIELARSNGASTAYVELNRYGTTTTVWQKTSTQRYYKYQFDTYYGYVSTDNEAQAWSNAYNYSHIIDQNGISKYDYYQKLKGNSTEYIERNVGGYYYNFSGSATTYKKATTVVDLSSATLKTADNGAYHWNGYMFLGFKHPLAGTTVEGGLRFEGTNGSTTIHPYIFYYDNNLQKHFIPYDSTYDTMSTATQNSDGSISFNDQIKLTLCLVGDNTMRLEVYNLTTGKFRQYTISDALIRESSPTRWLSCVSLVPTSNTNQELTDLRSGAYMRNVKLSNTSLYTEVTSTTAVAFNPSTSVSTWAFAYNTDCIDYSRNGTIETFNIFYDRA